MRCLQSIAATAALVLALGHPALAQRGPQAGDRGARAGRSDGAGPSQRGGERGRTTDRGSSRGNPSIADSLNVGAPPMTLPGLGSASLITPRPGVDAFRAGPGTYGRRSGGVTPRGPSWGGVPVSSGPSWGGIPVNRPAPDKSDDDRGRGPRRGSGRHQRGGSIGGYTAVYGVPYGYLPYDVAPPVTAAGPLPAASAQTEVPEGFLRLLVAPRHATVIVDGVVTGTVDDFGGTREQALPAGPHHIRIEAEGYEPVEFDVRVPPGDTISLRRELSALPARPREPEPGRGTETPGPQVRKTFYAIPRCYLGDTLPSADSLPPGCSLKDVRVLPQ